MALDPKSQPDEAEVSAGPPNFGSIEEALSDMRAMASWDEGWDGEEGPVYAEATLERASHFLTRCAREVWTRHRRAMPVPDIGPGPQGSIDFLWKVGERELLVNLPAETGDLVDFYGDTTTGEAVKGRVHASTVGPWLLSWLTQ